MLFVNSLVKCLSAEAQDLLLGQAAGQKSIVGVTIGNFDGMHIGHHRLISYLREELQLLAEQSQARPINVLFTFAPHPRRVFSKLSREERNADASLCQISSLRQKFELVDKSGVDLIFLQRFVKSFYSQSPEQFVRDYLVQALHAKLVVVGSDWSFGAGRAGTVEYLKSAGEEYGFSVRVVADVMAENQRVSSSALRQAIQAGELLQAERLLGRPYEIDGVVVHGHKRGRTLGYPTANVRAVGRVLPPNGVYAGWASVDGTRYPTAVSIGVRPVFESHGERLIEAYLISSDKFDLYGKRLKIELLHFLRGELRFDSVEALKKAIGEDVSRALALLS